MNQFIYLNLRNIKDWFLRRKRIIEGIIICSETENSRNS